MGRGRKKKYNRVVVKVGSSTLTHPGGKLNITRIDHLVRQLVDLKNQGREVLLVTSGAIAAGMGDMNLDVRPGSIPEQQALAALGQGVLIGLYNKFFREYGEKGAQILLTASDLEDRGRYLNAFNTLLTLLKHGVIPVINENDTVATQEIKFGDNDTLSARVAGLVEADLLIVLSDVEGLYNGVPGEGSDLEVIRVVEDITPDVEGLAGGRGSSVGTGGMITKIKAARIAVNSGVTMVIGPGYEKNVLLSLVDMLEKGNNYNKGTTFLPKQDYLTKRKQWLRFNLPVSGSIKVDKGAETALVYRGKSLLPGGITGVEGDFSEGEPVRVINHSGKEIGRGLVNYSSEEIRVIQGHHTTDISSLLGYMKQEEVIHRDNLVIERGKIDNGD
ncbi:glutamate 5-kinase [Halothermothrix orenii]|uniref:Glutamate 5-kinase n=1 Tax=Halothermothrix orenii (strain H 168 / OCM 544 / DSM 9562) TaxID=373903 RepID=B8D0Y5_HALOH|nr:glutamate 5-kinase [Halothermothrix orenii]ACL68954.1 glutamate 5-kinase [Halothermothrix orenii H 168]